MSRLIDADALRAAVMKILNNSIGGAYDGVYQCLEAINNAPTVLHDNYTMGYQDGVKKVLSEKPHGKWIDTGNMEEYWAEEYQCSICGEKDHWHDYCPNCGAYMGESEDNDYEQ